MKTLEELLKSDNDAPPKEVMSGDMADVLKHHRKRMSEALGFDPEEAH